MSTGWFLVLYCVLVALGSFAGGWIPMVLRLTHTRMQLAISFIGGAMLGIGILHLLPHAYLMLGSIDQAAWWMLGGFLLMFFIERVFHFHQHEAPAELQEAEEREHADHGHSHAHDHAHCHHGHSHAPPDSQMSWIAALMGLTVHSVLDGVALAASVLVESDARGALLTGLGVFLVVFLHKPFDSMTLGALMAIAKQSPRARWTVNACYALAVPAGAALFYFGGRSLQADSAEFVGAALAFAAGTFLCIATSDLLPELQFHTHDRMKLSSALLLGLALAWGIVFLETTGHDHHQHDVDAVEELEAALEQAG